MRYLLVLLLCSLCYGQDLKRPTADVSQATTGIGCTGSNTGSSAMTNAYDAAGLTTSSTISIAGSTSSSRYGTRIFSTWQRADGSYSALTLNINSSSGGNSGDMPGEACVAYSLNNGSTWTSVRCDSSSGWDRRTDTITLSASQDLSQLKVGVCASGQRGSAGNPSKGIDPIFPGSDSVTVWDIWTVGTTSAAAAGTGNTSGLAARRAVLVF